jgi:hypothetical protein
MVQVTWQPFTNNREPFEEPVDVRITNEITLARVVSAVISPHEEGKFDVNTVFQWIIMIHLLGLAPAGS